VSVAADLRTYLIADATIAAAIVARMYPGALKQGATLPAAVYHVISGQHEGSLERIEEAGEVRVQIDCHATTQLAAETLSAAMVARLKTLCEACPTTIGGGSKISDVGIQGPRDLPEGPSDGSDEWGYVSSLDALLHVE
jgi:hypothetical protein